MTAKARWVLSFPRALRLTKLLVCESVKLLITFSVMFAQICLLENVLFCHRSRCRINGWSHRSPNAVLFESSTDLSLEQSFCSYTNCFPTVCISENFRSPPHLVDN